MIQLSTVRDAIEHLYINDLINAIIQIFRQGPFFCHYNYNFKKKSSIFFSVDMVEFLEKERMIFYFVFLLFFFLQQKKEDNSVYILRQTHRVIRSKN